MNILLNNSERELYKEAIQELYTLCPETIKRKIKEANVQQGFMLDMVRKLCTKESRLLCVGSFEDTACESLLKLGYNVTPIDPSINTDLDGFFSTQPGLFDVVFSTSVIEHVQDDETFMDKICQLIKPGGYGVLTCDFNNSYVLGASKPSVDYRLYTKHDLLDRLHKILVKNNCKLYGDINYDGIPDFKFVYDIYSFATYTFVKN